MILEDSVIVPGQSHHRLSFCSQVQMGTPMARCVMINSSDLGSSGRVVLDLNLRWIHRYLSRTHCISSVFKEQTQTIPRTRVLEPPQDQE